MEKYIVNCEKSGRTTPTSKPHFSCLLNIASACVVYLYKMYEYCKSNALQLYVLVFILHTAFYISNLNFAFQFDFAKCNSDVSAHNEKKIQEHLTQ